jgi:hypothetical protein
MLTKNMLDTVERMLAVTRACGPESLIYLQTKRLFDRLYDAEVYERLTVAELAILTSIFITTLHEAFQKSDQSKVITL